MARSFWYVLKEELHAQRGSKGFQVLYRCKREIEDFGGPAIIFEAEMKDAGTKGDLFGGFERALHFVHGEDAFRFVARDQVESWLGMA